MAKLILKFKILLNDLKYKLLDMGPLFDWSPNGDGDSIILGTKYPVDKLKVWFGKSEEDLEHINDIEKCYNLVEEFLKEYPQLQKLALSAFTYRHYIISKTIYLLGLLEIENFDKDIYLNESDNEEYIKLGKGIVQSIQDPIKHLFDIIRINYGQYWVIDFEKWDSTKCSLGYYCRELCLKWSIDDGENWNDFIPDRIIPGGSIWQEFGPETIIRKESITKEDWLEIPKIIKKGYIPSYATISLIRTNKLLLEESRYAAVESLTTFDLCFEELFYTKLKEDKRLSGYISGICGGEDKPSKLTEPEKFIIIASILKVPIEDISKVVKMIKTRNSMVHKGEEPYKDIKFEIIKLLDICKKLLLLTGGRFKFPVIVPDYIMPEEDGLKGAHPRSRTFYPIILPNISKGDEKDLM